MKARQGEWRLEMPATIEAIEQFCAEFQVWRAGNCADLDPFGAELLLREALKNSVVHGCAEDPRQRISCCLRARPRRLVIAIHDGGEGFNWRARWESHAAVSDTDGRGIEILRHYADTVRFNPRGNGLAMVKRF